jgi:hypothetical protein
MCAHRSFPYTLALHLGCPSFLLIQVGNVLPYSHSVKSNPASETGGNPQYQRAGRKTPNSRTTFLFTRNHEWQNWLPPKRRLTGNTKTMLWSRAPGQQENLCTTRLSSTISYHSLTEHSVLSCPTASTCLSTPSSPASKQRLPG